MDIFMDADEVLPPLPVSDIATIEGSPADAMTELVRALRLALPSLNDHRGMAQTLRMILRKRGFDVMQDMRVER
jgi:hypothetical protein